MLFLLLSVFPICYGDYLPKGAFSQAFVSITVQVRRRGCDVGRDP